MIPFLVNRILAQVSEAEAIKEATDFLATKDIKWWLIAMAVVGVSFCSLIFKWLFASHQRHIHGLETQLTEQRIANSDLNSKYMLLYEKLLAYIASDHLKSIETQKEATQAIRMLTEAIDRTNVLSQRHSG